MCHLELDPFVLGIVVWEAHSGLALAKRWGRHQSFPAAWDKMQQVKQGSHCALEISCTIKLYAPVNISSVFHFKWHIRGISRSVLSFLFIGCICTCQMNAKHHTSAWLKMLPLLQLSQWGLGVFEYGNIIIVVSLFKSDRTVVYWWDGYIIV